MSDDTLLLVDDEENVRRSLMRLFRREPYKVIAASSGAEAIEMLKQEQVSVILSDQRMPGMTGSELFKTVKDLYPETIRLIMSGYTELESVTSAINDGAIFKFLTKPWDDDKLLVHIRDAFDLYKLKSSHQKLTEELRVLNATLEHRIKEEQQNVRMNIRSLQVAHEILEFVPMAIMGISDDGLVVNANRCIRTELGTEATVGCMMEDVLPEALCGRIRELVENGTQSCEFSMDWRGQRRKMILTRFNREGGTSGIIVVGCQPE